MKRPHLTHIRSDIRRKSTARSLSGNKITSSQVKGDDQKSQTASKEKQVVIYRQKSFTDFVLKYSKENPEIKPKKKAVSPVMESLDETSPNSNNKVKQRRFNAVVLTRVKSNSSL